MFTTHQTAQSVLTHWFADGLQLGWPSVDLHRLWFGGEAAQDRLIAEQFGDAVESALLGKLTEWETAPATRLALIVLLDQFTRNVHRGSARAFAGDGRAQKLVLQSLALGADDEMPAVACMFLYMPLMHAESLALQYECMSRFKQLHAKAPHAAQSPLANCLQSAQQHMDIIERFGRFPHRNAVLGRESTDAEIAFLHNGPRFGQ